MRSPLLNWACGIAALLGLPLGAIVVLSSQSFLAGLTSLITVVLVVLLACHKDIIREYKESKKRPIKNNKNKDI